MEAQDNRHGGGQRKRKDPARYDQRLKARGVCAVQEGDKRGIRKSCDFCFKQQV